MLAEMGLFTLTGDRYQFTEPTDGPCKDKLRAIALKLEAYREMELKRAETADDNSSLYPVQLITAMPQSHAARWEQRLNGMDQAHRSADRAVLL
jgi:hypothetical protein